MKSVKWEGNKKISSLFYFSLHWKLNIVHRLHFCFILYHFFYRFKTHLVVVFPKRGSTTFYSPRRFVRSPSGYPLNTFNKRHCILEQEQLSNQPIWLCYPAIKSGNMYKSVREIGWLDGVTSSELIASNEGLSESSFLACGWIKINGNNIRRERWS